MAQLARDVWYAKILAIQLLQYWYNEERILLNPKSASAEIYRVFGKDIPRNCFCVKIDSLKITIQINFPDTYGSFMKIEYDCNNRLANIGFQDKEFHVNEKLSFSCRNFLAFISSIQKFYREFPKNKELARKTQEFVESLSFEEQENLRLFNLAKARIKAAVCHVMENTGYEWKLEVAYDRECMLFVKVNDYLVLKVLLDVDSYEEKMPNLISAIEKMRTTIENMPFVIEVSEREWDTCNCRGWYME